MMMEFTFDKDKLVKEGYKEEQRLNAIRKHFKEYNSKTIKEIKKEYLKVQKMIGTLLAQQQDFHIQVGF